MSGGLPIFPTLAGLLVRGVPLSGVPPVDDYSVIVPLFNKEKTIKETLDSVFNQNRAPFEVVVIDDKSRDNSLEIVKKYAYECGGKLTVLENDENMGKANTLNRALSMIKTPFVLILDADTTIDPTFVQEVMRGFNGEDVQCVSGTVLPAFKKNNALELSRAAEYLYGQRLYKMLQTKFRGMWVACGCAQLWRTQFLLKHLIPNDTVVEDMDISWIAQYKNNVNYVPNAVCRTAEPENFVSYIRQINRWFSWRLVVGKHLTRVKRGLQLSFMWLMGEAIGLIAYLAILAYFAFSGNWIPIFLMALADFCLIMLVLYEEARKFKVGSRVILLGASYFYFLRWFNMLMFWKCLFFPKKKW